MVLQVAVQHSDLLWMKNKGFLSGAQVENLWQQLCDRCPIVSHESEKQYQSFDTVVVPELKGYLRNSTQHYDTCIAYSPKNGKILSRKIKDELIRQGKSVTSIQKDDNEPILDATYIESQVCNSTCLVVLMTENALQQPEIIFAMTAAKYYYDHSSLVILVHDAASCFFPGFEEQPPALTQFFSEKAVTFLECYTEEGVKEIINKYEAEKTALDHILKNFQDNPRMALYRYLSRNEERKAIPLPEIESELDRVSQGKNDAKLKELLHLSDKNKDGRIDTSELSELLLDLQQSLNLSQSSSDDITQDISTRVFLSHKRSTGQGIAGRLYEGLKSDYQVFLDSEAKFKIHNLRQIVSKTETFVFILSSGILLSKWCLEELKTAVSLNKQIIMVRDLSYNLPQILPEEWQPVAHVLKSSTELIWIAEYNHACISALKRMIGPKDSYVKSAQGLLETPAGQRIAQDIKNLVVAKGKLSVSNVQVSKKIAIDGLLWIMFRSEPELYKRIKTVVFRNRPHNEFSRYLEFLRGQGAVPDHINLSRCKKMTDEVLEYISVRLPDIRSLDLELAKVNDAGMTWISQCRHLEALNLHMAFLMTDEGIRKLAENCKQLKNLNLASCERLTDKSLQYLSECPNLVHLELGNNSNFTDEGIAKILKPNLKLLGLSLCKSLTVRTCETLAQSCPELSQLNISGLTNLTEEAGLSLSKCAHLTNLKMNDNPAVTDQFFFNFCQGTGGQALEEIFLKGCPALTDRTIEKIAHQCKNMKDFGISELNLLSDHAVDALLQLPKLEALRMGILPLVTDLAFQKSTNIVPTLRILRMPETKISDAMFQFIAKRFPNLNQLDISKCPNVTDVALYHIAKGCPSLGHFSADGCKITDDGLSALAHGCPKLSHVSLDSTLVTGNSLKNLINLHFVSLNSTKVSDDAIQQLSQTSPNLKLLYLSHCDLITDSAIQSVAKNCHDLEVLHLAHSRITDEAMKVLAEGCQFLQVLNIEGVKTVTEQTVLMLSQGFPRLQELQCLHQFKNAIKVLQLSHSVKVNT